MEHSLYYTQRQFVQKLISQYSMRSESSEEEPAKKIQKQEQAYSKLKILGEGSMGKAYLVKCNKDDQLYVMKRINIGYLSADEKEVAKREAQLHSIVSHPNIINFKQIYHTTKDKLCIIMEYASGGDLDNFVNQRQGKLIPEDQVIELFSQLCLGVREIHAKKIIHRDLKAANIFLAADNQVKIGDFGISKIAEQTVQASKSFVGTPYYLSPEMVEGKKYSTKADIWSLGVILYNLCTLKLPFQANSLPLLALKILRGSFPPVPGPYSRQLKSLILSLLQVNQTKRPSINQILAKPLITKYTGEVPTIKTNPQTASRKVIPSSVIPVAKKKQTINKEAQKNKQKQRKDKQKQKRDKAKQKRETLRKQMQQQLRQKRKQNTKNHSPVKNTTIGAEGLKNFKSSPQFYDQIQTREQKKVFETHAEKPWKVKKEQGSKKQIEVQMFLPQDRPKKLPEPQLETPLSPQNDFKVEIFVSRIPDLPATKSEPSAEDQEDAQSQNYYESQESEQDYYSNQKRELDQILNQVNGAQKAVLQIKGNYQEIQLLQQSELFDNEADQKPKENKKLSQEDEESLRFMNSSQNLEECRQILEQGLGEQNFIKSYNILNQHLCESAQKKMNGKALDDYTFNRQVIREKLDFLGDAEFARYVVLMYTLIIMEDEEMKKNLDGY